MNITEPTTLSHFRSKLRERALVLREEIRQTLLRSDQESHVAIAEQARDMQDDALADLLVDINLAEIDRDVGELRIVESALRRIDAANYGRCADCGDSIALDRLEASPAAECCVPCQEARDRMRLRTPSL